MISLLPSSLTLARLIIGVILPFVAPSWQLWLILVGAATDLVDGQLARWLGVDGSFGKYLDPIADKVFVLGVLCIVVRDGLVSFPALALLMLRDIVVVSGTVLLLAVGRRDVFTGLRPSVLGKVTTAFQFTYLLVVIWIRDPLTPALVVVIAVTVLASVDYVRRAWLAATAAKIVQPTLK